MELRTELGDDVEPLGSCGTAGAVQRIRVRPFTFRTPKVSVASVPRPIEIQELAVKELRPHAIVCVPRMVIDSSLDTPRVTLGGVRLSELAQSYDGAQPQA